MSLPRWDSADVKLEKLNVSPEVYEDPPKTKGPSGLGIRHLQTFLMFLGFMTAYMLRASMSVAIVAMSNSTTANPDIEDFGWDSGTQSMILSSFAWGYVVTQLPGSQIAHMWSAYKLWAISMFICGAASVVIPIGARTGGWIAVCACRVVMGLCQGCIVPCAHNLLGKWVPPSERGRLGTYSYAGMQFGTVVGLPISGLLAASAVGWPSVFYICGTVTIVWSIVFFIWGADSPAQHRSIKPAEKNYIMESLNQVEVKEQLPTPWKLIFTSVPLWSLIIVHCGQNWGFWTLLTEIPTYMNAILGFDISQNGLLSALPYLAMLLLSFPVSFTSDYVLKRGWVTRATARKVSNSIGHWGPGVALIGLGYVTSKHTALAVAVLVLTVGLNAGIFAGYQINHIDLSPNFAGTLMGITNCIANVMGIVAPLVAGLIVVDTSDITQWRTVFFISAAVYFACNFVFVFYGQGEVQPWNEPKRPQNPENGKFLNGDENPHRNTSEEVQEYRSSDTKM